MPEWLRLALVIAGKDLRAELRSRTAILSAVVFAALVLVVFNFARDPTALAAVDLAPSVLWVTFALAAMLALNRAFTIEQENAALDGLLLAPVPREALFAGKLLANLAFVGTVEAVTLPLFVLFFNVDLGAHEGEIGEQLPGEERFSRYRREQEAVQGGVLLLNGERAVEREHRGQREGHPEHAGRQVYRGE
ncbi:MAG TPA: heme exporter protein CcmB, partial [Gemmatimonadales bacterium]|nr:heme exporter protein CcmB [Gemmatimonadales bacterium]